MSATEDLLIRLRLLARRRLTLLVGAVWLLGSLLLWRVRLVGVLGFPHALLQTPVAGLAGLLLGLSSGRLARALRGAVGEGRARLPAHLLPKRSGGACIQSTFGSAALLGLLLLLLVWGLGLLGGALLGACRPLSGAGWLLLLPLPSLLLGCALGVGLALLARRGLSQAALLLTLLFGFVLLTALPLLTGPVSFAYDHLLGVFPGPLYDERSSQTTPLLAFRALTLVWTGLVLLALAMTCDPLSFRLRRPRLQPKGLLALGLGLLIVGTGFLARHQLGTAQSFESLNRALGGEVRAPGLVIHYPKERDAAWVKGVLEDHLFRYQQLTRYLHLDPTKQPLIHSYIFRDAKEKARLTGAGATSIAKPWLHAIYLNDRGWPHPVLTHELTHALSAGWGSGPFQVSGGLIPNTGLVEGLAVAAAWPSDTLTVHQWAQAMRRIGVAPPIASLFSASGFWSASASRAYTLAGSFVRYLIDTHGVDAVRKAYHAGSLRPLGDPPKLIAAWEHFLDGLPLSKRAERLARDRFTRPGILRRPCAFDVRALHEAGAQALADHHLQLAATRFRRCRALEPDDPAHLDSLLRVAEAGDDPAAVAQARAALLAHPKLSNRARARVLAKEGDEAWAKGDDTLAAVADAAYAQAQAYAVRDSERRLLFVKRFGLARPALWPTLRPFLLGQASVTVGAVRLHQALQRARASGSAWAPKGRGPDEAVGAQVLLKAGGPRDLPPPMDTKTEDKRLEATQIVPQPDPERAILAYLLGRQLYNTQGYEACLPFLREALKQGLPGDEGLWLENLRLTGSALAHAGQLVAARKVYAKLLNRPARALQLNADGTTATSPSLFVAPPALAARAQEALQRIDFLIASQKKAFPPTTQTR